MASLPFPTIAAGVYLGADVTGAIALTPLGNLIVFIEGGETEAEWNAPRAAALSTSLASHPPLDQSLTKYAASVFINVGDGIAFIKDGAITLDGNAWYAVPTLPILVRLMTLPVFANPGKIAPHKITDLTHRANKAMARFFGQLLLARQYQVQDASISFRRAREELAYAYPAVLEQLSSRVEQNMNTDADVARQLLVLQLEMSNLTQELMTYQGNQAERLANAEAETTAILTHIKELA